MDLSAFNQYLIRERDLADLTASNRVGVVGYLLKVLPSFTPQELDNLLFAKKKAGAKPPYLNNLILAARAWAEYNHIDGFAQMKLYTNPDRFYSNKKTLSDEQIVEFLNLPYLESSHLPKAIYDFWTRFYTCLFYSGLRPRELANIELSELDMTEHYYVLYGPKIKTKRSRDVPMSELGFKAVQEQLQYAKDGFLFTIPRINNCLIRFPGTKRPTKDSWGLEFNRRLKRMGIKDKQTTVYSTRHSCATLMLKNGADLKTVSEILGHRDLNMTAIYTHPDRKDKNKAQSCIPALQESIPIDERIEKWREDVLKLGIQKDSRVILEQFNSGDVVWFKVKKIKTI